jgi:NitT/TauT family transport system substrate-binding protein
VEGRYPGPGQPFVAPGSADFDLETAQVILTYLDAGAPLVALAGIHLGCYELFAHRAIHSIPDLRGKTIPITGLGGDKHVFLSSMLAYVGLDPHTDVHWLEVSSTEAIKLFVTGKVDAFLGFPPEPQELRAKRIGRVIVNTSTDKPWSQYYCCMLYTHPEFVRMYPMATKRIVRAILKATDLCALEPERAAREIVEKGYVQDYDYAVETLRQVPYNAWRTYAPEDTLRFYAVRLHDAGIIKGTPNKLISQGTDWRFLETLRKELKA